MPEHSFQKKLNETKHKNSFNMYLKQKNEKNSSVLLKSSKKKEKKNERKESYA